MIYDLWFNYRPELDSGTFCKFFQALESWIFVFENTEKNENVNQIF